MHFYNVWKSILIVKSNKSISNIIIYTPLCWILYISLSILFFDFYLSLSPAISFSYNNKINLIIVTPKENTSLFSGLNSPIPEPFNNYKTSGDI